MLVSLPSADLDMAGDGGGGGLQPIDPHRLFVAGHLAEADVHKIAAVQHLAGGLGEAAFVAVERRQAENARQPQHQAEQRQHGIAVPRQPVKPRRRTDRSAVCRRVRAKPEPRLASVIGCCLSLGLYKARPIGPAPV